MLKNKNIILGVTGGIAVYKSVDLVSKLKKRGANVEVIMTKASQEFVNPLTFQTMSVNPVHTSMFNEIDKFDVEHISLAQKGDIILIAPATANTIGKIANGIADNLLTTVVMASNKKIIFAPAMNTCMYNNPIVESNMKKLEQLGYEFIKPGTGRLACGDYGAGKMAEPEDIVEYIDSFLTEKDLEGKDIIITAGPTIEAIDPVRYITNHSSGKMGYSIAKEALKRGAKVHLISGPTSLKPPKGVDFISVNTTDEMFKEVGKLFESCDILIKSAAPADLKPKKYSEEKIKKKQLDKDTFKLEFIRNPDIAEHYGNNKKNQIVIGFAAETNDLIKNAKSKLEKKNFDFIVANDITKKGAGFKTDTNIISIIDNDRIEDYPIMGKEEIANIILDKAVKISKNKS
ncbi:bifunctional phosphopantothenoylcysteine decarboxylase/phosphopantothenate--cysteine ligase CoaBC [Tissierella creatinophila]|uniref:Coenzyme A biosynthesis bifunctional protein CoaBC n=1 Tax=Tissierella creatinophila DSM 6911 TaxID=1123403 RepID=A0A1U7M352_TISCR|nr:bifunctional phosphopantothenoylcysteine decarboxylase/phosphopantothenate--cysteine ligase CoaBC [Tissierella creatinophila]OLS01705.1 coenzyme A biosynthesis bifunctional protein CoaBC [Tissierella creatinophila DSM 6911]